MNKNEPISICFELAKRCASCDCMSYIGAELYCNEFEKPCCNIDFDECDYGMIYVTTCDDEIIDTFINIDAYNKAIGKAV